MADVNIRVDTKAFDKALKDYMVFTNKSVSEVINAKLWFITREAINKTPHVERSTIASELSNSATDYPGVPLGAILTNIAQKKKGRKGLTGRDMTVALKKFIGARQRSTHFLRAGWLPALRIFDLANKRGDIKFSKRFAPKLARGVKQYGKDKGSAIYARPNQVRAFGEIENSVEGGKNPNARVGDIIRKGLQEAINKEVASMRTYIERKMNPEINKFNR